MIADNFWMTVAIAAIVVYHYLLCELLRIYFTSKDNSFLKKVYYSGYNTGKNLGISRGIYTTLFALDMAGVVSYNEKDNRIFRVGDKGEVQNEIFINSMKSDDPRIEMILRKVDEKIVVDMENMLQKIDKYLSNNGM